MSDLTVSAHAAKPETVDCVTRAAGLDVVHDLLGRLHAADMAYCHWKSNNEILASIEGWTDLDLLVERRRVADLQCVLALSGFRRFQATSYTVYPAIEDYLGFDPSTGRIVHLHLHYQLTLGQPHLKGYRLPWEDYILAKRRLDSNFGIYVAAPEVELILLLVRDALKRRLRSTIVAAFQTNAGSDFKRQYDWLINQVDAEEVVGLAGRLIGSESEEPLRRLFACRAAQAERRKFAAVVRPSLRYCRTFGVVSSEIIGKFRELFWYVGGFSRRRFHWPVPLRRTSPRGGAVVALLGSDGAGKSSLCVDTVNWLSFKLDVVPVYFGSGDGSTSLLRLPLQLARRLYKPSRTIDTSGDSRRDGVRHRLRSVAMVPWALTLSLEKRGKLRGMIRARNRGMIVVCDRYAQAEIHGFNDGRLLADLERSRWRIARALARWEAQPYLNARIDPPDLVIKLIASPNVALGRRPDMNIEEIERRVAAVRSLTFPEATSVIEINADMPFEQVMRAARQAIWGIL